jgi:hypothetical protein
MIIRSKELQKRIIQQEKESKIKTELQMKEFLDSWIRPGSVLRSMFDKVHSEGQ